VDPKTGLFTPIITGFAGQLKGIAFLPTGLTDNNAQGDNNAQD